MRPNRYTVGLILLLGLHAAIAAYASSRLSPCMDESAHIRAGMSQLTRNVFVDGRSSWTWPDPLHPPMDAVPASFAALAGQSPDYRGEFATPFPRVRAARWANHLMGALILLLVFLWARRLWGPAGALLAAAALLCHPLFIAHSSIVSSDLYSALGTLVVAYGVWRVFLAAAPPPPGGGAKLWLGCGVVALGVAFAILCKISNLVFLAVVPAAGLWAGLTAARGGAAPWVRTCTRFVAAGFLAGLLGVLIAAVVYEGMRPGQPAVAFAGVEVRLPFGQPMIRAVHAITELAGLSGPIYFDGRMEAPAARHYLIALWIKTPPAILVLALLTLLVSVARMASDRRRAVPFLLALTISLGAIFVCSDFYLGIRHLLPLFPLAAILAGGLLEIGRIGSRVRLGIRVLVLACLVWAGAESLAATPWQMSYFNAFDRHRTMLVDSDGDWGQGLVALRDWQRAHGRGEPLWLAYFGSNRPEDFGVEYRGMVSPYSPTRVDRPPPFGRDPAEFGGFVAISQTQLAGRCMRHAGLEDGYYARWREREPAVVVAGTINIYDCRADRRAP